MRNFLYHVTMFVTVMTALSRMFMLIQWGIGNVDTTHVRGIWISQNSSPQEVITFLFASVILMVAGFGAIVRPKLGFFGMAAGYMVEILSYVSFLYAKTSAIHVAPLNHLTFLFGVASAYVVAGCFEDDSKKNDRSGNIGKLNR